MALQDAVGYNYNVAIIIRELLPHIFTLTVVCSLSTKRSPVLRIKLTSK